MPPKRKRDDHRAFRGTQDRLQIVMASFQNLIATINALPSGHNDITKDISKVQNFIQQFYDNSEPSPTIPATSMKSAEEAALAVQVIWKRHSKDHLWQLRDNEGGDKSSELSPWADTAISKILESPYFQLSRSEANFRTVIDILFCDRLEQLEDSESVKGLNWFPEMSLSVKSTQLNKVIQGRADNCLAYGIDKTESNTALIVLYTFSLEAKVAGSAGSALPQLIIYLAAVQDIRKETLKINSSVFGLMTDSSQYMFVFLNEDRQLFTSKAYTWTAEKGEIIRWVDRMLQDAIQATPHTTPIKAGNHTIHNYPACLNQHYQTGVLEVVDTSDERRWKVVETNEFGEWVVEVETDDEA